MLTFSILIYLLGVVESREIMYTRVNLDGPAIMEYSVSLTDVAATECGRLCTSTSGCNLFHYESRNCYILNSPGTSSVNITTFYGSENWRGSCTIPDYPLFGGKFCMKISNAIQNWTTANITCSENGGQLLTMKSDDYFLKKEVLNNTVEDYRFWIDGNDLKTESDWRWADGSRIQSDQWMPDNPNNVNGIEHCLALKDMLLNDARCVASRLFICEKKKL